MPTRFVRPVVCRFPSVLLLIFAAPSLVAEDAFYQLPLDELEITEGEVPSSWQSVDWQERQRARLMMPYAVLDGQGEVYLGSSIGPGEDAVGMALPAQWPTPGETDETAEAATADADAVAIRAPRGKAVTGSLFVPKTDHSGMVRVRFRAPASAASETAETNFHLAKAAHYGRLLARDLAGAAWFRHQRRAALQAAGQEPAQPDQPAQQIGRRSQENDLQETYAVFTGGRAVSENLQLDRVLAATAPDKATVDLDTLEGITIAEMDWEPLIKGSDTETDPLASLIPADQHALFFPSFSALTTLLDEATEYGTPVLDLVQPRAEDARSRERYERQLCLAVGPLERLLGEQAIRSVAVTGGDPYFRTGTDVAVLFEAKNADALRTYVTARQQVARDSAPECKPVDGRIEGLEYSGVVSPDRRICSYVAAFDDTVVVSNSLVQLKRLAQVRAGKVESLASLPEYRFFRQRYRRSESGETALLLVTDATIRRWCSPKWRIASSRRTRAAAVLAEQHARHATELVRGSEKPRPLDDLMSVPEAGTLRVMPSGVVSSTYGSLEFLTPISELDLAQVTPAEAEGYGRWRDSYQRYWRQFFDPIAVRFSIREGRLAADLSVMPLIDFSSYRNYVEITGDAKIAPEAGDPHPDTLLHGVMAIDTKSHLFRQADDFLENVTQSTVTGWLGDTVAAYLDKNDPFWADFAQAEDKEAFLGQEFHRLPIAFRAEVSDGLKLALFVTGLRAAVQQSAPGITRWQTQEHKGRKYVRISAEASAVSPQLQIYYATLPDALIVTPNKNLLRRALERSVWGDPDEKNGEPPAKEVAPWLGESLALQVDGDLLSMLEPVFADTYRSRQAMQVRAWANIPVLNEWKRLFPDRDPLALHERLWTLRLRCPGGGRYVWNQDYATMESTVYGHPGQPRSGPAVPPLLHRVRHLNFGLTFEHQGLRARAVIDKAETAGSEKSGN